MMIDDDDSMMEYVIDRKLLEKVERISLQGYKGTQEPIIKEMETKGITDEARFDYMKKHILVKEDKPHRLYHFYEMFEDLKNVTAERFAVAIKGKPENLQCRTAFELLFITGTRFQSINSFRECLTKNMEESDNI